MTTHVFIVDKYTFPLHLEYLFAGTGAGNKKIDFNDTHSSKLHPTTENNLAEMIADSQRVRKDDSVIFYLQQDFSKKVFDGKFYGFFKIKNDKSFLDPNDEEQYLKENLEKSLTLRTFIEPDEVYPEGVTEWEALDEIKNIASPHQMIWSLIYRKLKGKRGNTMITTYEADRLKQLIRNKNHRNIINNPQNLSFDLDSQRIISTLDERPAYHGRTNCINILPRLIQKKSERKAFEKHLQAYIVQNIGLGTNQSLDSALLNGATIEWLGNEVGCGFGMRKIDIMFSTTGRNKTIFPIEVKCGYASPENLSQLQRYINWIAQYYLPNKPSDIQPLLLSQKCNKNTGKFKTLQQYFANFNSNNNQLCKPIKYIEFDTTDDNINFNIYNYNA